MITLLIFLLLSQINVFSKNEIQKDSFFHVFEKKKIGKQKFQNKSTAQVGYFSWNLKTNTFEFDYENINIKIANEKMYVTQNGETKTYPAVGIAKFFTNPVKNWAKITKEIGKGASENISFIILEFEEKTIYISYEKEPFLFKSIIISEPNESTELIFAEN